jgi:hypothetical protein
MNRFLVFVSSLTVAAGLLSPSLVRACPNCQEAIASSADASSDPAREPRAYNHSIYLMAGMPYLLLGLLSFKIYQNIRKSDVKMQAMAEALEDPSEVGTRGEE